MRETTIIAETIKLCREGELFIRIGSFKMFDSEVLYAQNETLLLDIFRKIYFHYSIVNRERYAFTRELRRHKTAIIIHELSV